MNLNQLIMLRDKKVNNRNNIVLLINKYCELFNCAYPGAPRILRTYNENLFYQICTLNNQIYGLERENTRKLV